MNLDSKKIMLGLYLRGNALDPCDITAILGISPDYQQVKGESVPSSAGRAITRTIGVWSIKVDAASENIAEPLAEFFTRLNGLIEWGARNSSTLLSLPGVDEGYVDMFVCGSLDTDDQGKVEVEIQPDQVALLAKLHLPLRITFELVRE